MKETFATKEYTDRHEAYRLYHDAIREGTLVPQRTCSVCGKKRKTVGHHPDYARPIHVLWVCGSCHLKIHDGQIAVRKRIEYFLPQEAMILKQES